MLSPCAFVFPLSVFLPLRLNADSELCGMMDLSRRSLSLCPVTGGTGSCPLRVLLTNHF